MICLGVVLLVRASNRDKIGENKARRTVVIGWEVGELEWIMVSERDWRLQWQAEEVSSKFTPD